MRAEPTFSRSFNGPETTWQLLETSTPAKFLTHECIPGGARDTKGLERIAVAAAAGQSVQLMCPTPSFAVLDELKVRLWVKSSRPDIQLAARIVLPRSLDPQRRTTATAIVKGAAYTRPGHWQELVLTDVPKLLAAQVRVMRTTPGAAIDSHEAYLDSIVLVVPGDPNGVEIGTDQLEIDGVEITPPKKNNAAEAPSAANDASVPATLPRVASPATRAVADVAARSAPGERKSPVRLQGSILLVDDKPFMPRAIQWNGESLQYLSERGFNVVELPTPPTAEQIADATRYELWFLCVPPRPEALARDGVGAVGDRVLGWCLEDEAIEADPNYAMRWADLVRERDAVYGRPIILSPKTNWSAPSRAADIVIAANPRASRMTAAEYERWFNERPNLIRPGTPLWARFSTQFGEAVRLQTNALTRTSGPAPFVEGDQLESLVHVACTNGAQGLIFQSSSSLSAADPATKRRAAVVELVNRRLQLMEPWLAGGKVISRVTATNGTFTSKVLYFDRARLLIPVSHETKQQTTPAPSANLPSKEVTFLVPGVPESSQVYFLTTASMRSLSSQRVAGGTRLTLPSTGGGLVVITEDPKVVQGLRQRITRHASKTARLERDLLVEQTQSIFDIDRRISQLGAKPTVGASEASSVNSRLSQLDSLLSAGQLEQAQDVAAEVARDAKRMISEQQRAAGLSTGLQSNALGLTASRLAEFVTLQQSFQSVRENENLLAGGDFENLNEMTQFGWQHIIHPTAGAETHAELSALQPHHGAYCLELKAAAATATQSAAVDDALVWIVSPGMQLESNATVEITGWVRVDQPFSTSGEGLAVIDSLGGPELSLLVSQTSGWETFRLVRAVPQASELRLTFALNGLGSAKVDAVMVRTLQQPIARRLPAVPEPKAARLPGVAPK